MNLPEQVNVFFNMILDMVPIRLPECEWCGDPMFIKTPLCEECAWDLMCGGLNPNKRNDND